MKYTRSYVSNVILWTLEEEEQQVQLEGNSSSFARFG